MAVAPLTPADALKRDWSAAPARLFLLWGKEEGQKRDVLERLRATFGADDFDTVKMDAGDANASRILEEAMAMPAFSPVRLVLVRAVQKVKATEAERLAGALAGLPETTVLILYTHAEDEEARGNPVAAKLLHAVEKLGVVISCQPLKPAQFDGWLREELKACKKKMEPDAQELMGLLTARNVSSAESELQKLILYVGERAEITREDVDAIVSRTPEAQVFALVNSIATGQAAKAMTQLGDIYATGGRAESVTPRLLALIARQSRLLWQMRASMDHPNAAGEWMPREPNLGQLLQRQPYLERELRAQAQRLNMSRLARAFRLMSQADCSMKGILEGEADSRRRMERLVADLCRLAAR